MNTELMKAVDALGKVLAFAGSENQADWQTVLAALRDLEAENARLESAWHVETLNEKDRLIAAQEAEKDHVKSRLAAANALLREVLITAGQQHDMRQLLQRIRLQGAEHD